MYQARLGMLMTRESKFLVKVVTAVQNSEKSFMIEIQWFNSHWNSFQKCCGWKQEKLLITFLNSVPSWQVLNGLEAMGYKVGLKTLSLKKWRKKIYFKIQQGEKCLKRDIAGKENLLLSFSIFYQVISCGSYMTGEQRHDCREFVWTLFKTKDEWDGSSKWKVGEAEHLSGFSPLCFSQGRLIKLIFWSLFCYLITCQISSRLATSRMRQPSVHWHSRTSVVKASGSWPES